MNPFDSLSAFGTLAPPTDTIGSPLNIAPQAATPAAPATPTTPTMGNNTAGISALAQKFLNQNKPAQPQWMQLHPAQAPVGNPMGMLSGRF